MTRVLATILLAVLLPALVHAYPLDGYPETGIRRVEGARLANEGIVPGRKQPAGALLSTAEVDLRLLDYRDLDLPAPDPAFTSQILKLLGNNAGRYGVAVLDLTDPAQPRYAEHRGDYRQNVGSVGKLLVALGLFQALADAWPDDLAKRRQTLKETIVTADEFCHWDHHKIRIFDVENRKLTRRTMKDGDQGSLWEYLDWTLSVSSNAAAAMTMREAMLLRQYGKDYPPPEQEIQRFFEKTPKKQLTELFQRTFFAPVTRNGLDLEQLRQGSFFTREGKRRVPGGGNSYGTARELMNYVLRMEQGRLVDEFSSREIKRLLYLTERRIRYASSPALRDSAVYFKSGSLYSCQEEEGFKCGKYMGNVKNYMNSVATVETSGADHRLDYIVTLISNVLRKNSAVDHQTLGTRIHRLIEKAHPAPRSAGEQTPAATGNTGN
ncbi:MAG: serine hydrolase [Gammaproteobacteria bacterium]|nr:MAG: serine hydrolase [Gammaproteobacteria bacterium]